MPRGDRRNNRDDDDEGGQNRNHYWSLRDIPKFEGKGEQPYSHLMEFEDYLVASGISIEPDDEPDIETSSTNSKHHSKTMQEFGIVCILKTEYQTYTQLMVGRQ